ncbi:MAG: redoxin domain-containing protein [Planctomycetota bacterium]
MRAATLWPFGFGLVFSLAVASGPVSALPAQNEPNPQAGASREASREASEEAVQEASQDERAETYGHSHLGGAFNEGPRSAAILMPGISAQVHFPIEGLGATAQQFFDQGICQQHGFWHFEAERSFRQVAKLQPDCAMAYWGMARANDENAERAAGFICQAIVHSDSAPAREQQWIDAWARYYRVKDDDRKELRSGDAKRIEKASEAVVERNKERKKEDLDKLDKRLLKDLGTIVFDYPDDIEAKAFLAIQNWLAYRWGGGVPIVSHTAVDALLDQVFAKAPLHPAHHYRIHLWDREDARRALDSAAKNGSTAPSIAHQWHMPGHIYAKLHRHAEAAWQQEASSRADHAHMMRDGVMPFLIHNYAHNQEWLARSLGHCGRVEEALAIAKNLVELPRHPEHNQRSSGRTAAGYGTKRLIQLCEDHELWQQAVTLVDQGFLEQSDDSRSEVDRLRLLGRAYFRLQRLDDGERIAKEAEQLLAKARRERSAAMDAAEDEAFSERHKRKQTMAAIADAGEEQTSVVQRVLDLKRQLASERLLANGDAAAALLELDGVNVPLPLRAGLQVAAGKIDEAVKALEKANKKNPSRAAVSAALYRAVAARGEAGKKRSGELAAELVGSLPSSYLDRLEIDRSASAIAAEASFADDFGARPPLDSIGPRTWSPVANRGYSLPNVGGTQFDLLPDGAGDGRAKLVVFYLGFGCLHCVEQLHALRPLADEFAAAGVDVVAIGTDTVANTAQAVADLPAAERPAFPMLCDPKLASFRAWRCFDDFEEMALHGTFLVDGQGRVRWQDVSYEPFMKLEWLVAESRRLLALPVADGQ